MTETEMIFNKDYAVHSYETDARGLVKASSLLNYLQDAAGEHASRLGVGVRDLVRRNMTWVLSRYHIVIRRYPAMGARIEVTTWPSAKRGHFALRDFEASDADGPVLSATSSWMVIALDRKQPVKVDEAIAGAVRRRAAALEDLFDSLPVPEARDAEVRFRVESGHIDWNRHVNNAVYVQWALEAAPAEVLKTLRPAEIEVSYRAEAFFGDEVVSAVRRAGSGEDGPGLPPPGRQRGHGAELARLRTRWERGLT
ncbi:MAG: thioesterase [Candidatus Moduliflexus flocculans]|nr:thioesterase [Candidatus Moduliflexus flocculans]